MKFQNAPPPTVMILFNGHFSKYSLWQSSQKFLIGILKVKIYLKKKRLEFLLTWNPMGVKISNTIPPAVLILF